MPVLTWPVFKEKTKVGVKARQRPGLSKRLDAALAVENLAAPVVIPAASTALMRA
ncbi:MULTISPECIES: hypothetical protein [unclassified Bradyrhizobium]|uniref:hypothetical protein n=1 Tax=unclassified Bradyrhizobium TaxID=2631580 RepID=UPI003394EF2D